MSFKQILNRDRLSSMAAEFLGTGVLAMLVLILSQTTVVSYFIATSVAVALAAAYLLFGAVSGGHFNPAVTFGLWTARAIDTVRAASYMVAQVLGALGAWLLYQYLVDHKVRSGENPFDWRLLVAEAIGAAVLVMAYAAVYVRRLNGGQAGFTVAAGYFVGVMIAAGATASLASVIAKGFINPAVAVAGQSFNWVYMVGPLVGALVGANLYMQLFNARAKKPARKKRK